MAVRQARRAVAALLGLVALLGLPEVLTDPQHERTQRFLSRMLPAG